MLHKELTDRIIACFYRVYTNLGYGFLEKVYENAMLIELNKNGLKAISQYPIKVNYDGVSVGEYFADIIVEDKVIIELKASANLVPENILQLQNYLKATNIEVGLLLNFGKKPEIRRKTFHNNLKSF
ncbi:MAG: GxxExxY protein [Atribacterota bacterium]|nr:GxxExxY protein [Atribacterota bacterium]